MWIPGLVSVSFREETPETILREARAAGLQAVEWGGDVHVPAGDIQNARRVGFLTREAGLRTAAYGSYYRLGEAAEPRTAFAPVLETARALEAPVIRLWAGTAGSAQTPPEKRRALEEEARLLAGIAEEAGVVLTLECHPDTLTDDWKSAADFLAAVGHPSLRMYWQPNPFQDEAYNRRAAAELASHTVNLHVFHWDAVRRYPLDEGRDIWRDYLKIFEDAWRDDETDHALLLEFMHDNRLASLRKTAAELLSWR